MEVKKQAESVEIKKFTGVAGFNVVAINPTQEELKAIGAYAKDEPTYLGDKDGVDTVRVDVWIKNEEVLTKMAFFLENKVETAKSGKVKLINDIAQNTWADSIQVLKDNPNMSWFKTDTVREAKQGETHMLTEFFHKWLGLSYGNREKEIPADTCKLDLTKIFKGDFSEMKKFVKPCLDGGNGIKVLLGVTEKDGKYYQSVYMKHLMLPSNRAPYAKLAETLAGEYGEFKADYQGSFEFKEYVPGFVQPDVAKSTAPAVTSNALPF